MSTKRDVVVICRNISSPLRRVLSLFLIEVAPLTFCGRISTRVKDKIWEELQEEFSSYEITLIDFTNNNENGFNIKENVQMENRNTTQLDGVVLSTRRIPKQESWETVLGKSIPIEYPLFKHLIDTSIFAELILEKIVSQQQINIMINDLDINKDMLVEIIKFAAGMHDIGKCNPEWQVNTLKIHPEHESLKDLIIPETINKDLNKWRHDINSGVFFANNSRIKNTGFKKLLTEISASHHGDFNVSKEVLKHSKYSIDLKWVETQQKIEEKIIEVLELENIIDYELKINNDNDSVRSKILITGIVVLADWLASRGDFIVQTENQNSYKEYRNNTRKIANKHMNLLGLNKPLWKKEITWESMFPQISTPNDFQKSFIEQQETFKTNGLTLISAPMGIGKTETALYLASINGSHTNNSGFWLTLPTQATANAIFERSTEVIEKIYSNKENSVALLHSNSKLNEAMEKITKKNKRVFAEDVINYKENMDDFDESSAVELENSFYNASNLFISEFLVEQKTGGMSSAVISTVDQAINSVTPLKHNMLRWLSITGKTIILDEVHDFDSYTFNLIEKFLEWAGYFNLNIILMSASLSEKSQKKLVKAYAGNRNTENVIPNGGINSPSWVHIKNYNNESINKNVSNYIKPQEYNEYTINMMETDSPTDEIEKIIKNNKNANTLVVSHTVNQAISFYRKIKENYDGEVILLHSRMTENEKQKILKNILSYSGKPGVSKERKPHILISTQLVQQSMDIDYDLIISIMSPLPELLQRIGRVYRHDQGDRRAQEYINNPQVYLLIDKTFMHILKNRDFTIEDTYKLNKASSVPYSEWEILITLFTIDEYTKNEKKKNIKKDIAKIFDLYYQKENDYKTRNKFYSNLYALCNVKDSNKNSRANDNSVNSPYDFRLRDGLPSLNLTRNITQRSRYAPTTRDIQETKDVVFVLNIDDEIAIFKGFDKNNKHKFDKISYDRFKMNKILGLNSISVSKYFYDKYLADFQKNVTSSLIGFANENISFIDYNLLSEVVLSNDEGLSFWEIPSSKFLWV